MRSVSIVMTYYNRPDQLRQTIRSLRAFYGVNLPDIEVVIVDDGSSPALRAAPILSDMKFSANLIEITPEEKTWVNPCIPFNRGFKAAQGEIVVIQNAESMHLANILNTVRSQLDDMTYLTFPCYSTTQDEFHRILGVSNAPDIVWHQNVLRCIEPLKNLQWYHHPQYVPTWYHFCSALTRRTLNQIGGFDERFSEGYCFEDNAFLLHIQRKGLRIPSIHSNQGYVAHLWHPKNPGLRGGCPLWEKNRQLYQSILHNERGSSR